MKNTNLLFLLFTLFALFACQNLPEEERSFAEKVAKSHQKEDFLQKGAIRFDLRLVFGGRELYKGKIWMNGGTSKIRLDYDNGKTLLLNNGDVYLSPDTLKGSSGRFALYTWSYFFAFPYKLQDPRTQWSATPHHSLKGVKYHSELLTFGEGAGDTPDDWYIAYADPQTYLLRYAAYIATGGGSVAEAEEDPHAIEYLDYQEVEGVPIATQWKFWAWRKEAGLTEELGFATLSNIQFVSGEDWSKPSKNSRLLK